MASLISPKAILHRKAVLGLGLGILAIAVAVICFQDAGGQEPSSEPKKPVATTDPLDGFPAQREVGYVSFRDPSNSDELVSVGIYPESPQSPVRRPGMYYHRPMFAFKENGRAIRNYPPIVLSESPQADGSAVLGFRVKLTSDKLRTMCRNVVLKEDRRNALKEAGAEDKVQVSPWPLQGDMIVVCRNKDTEEILATKVLPVSTRTEVYVPLRFAADKLKQFQTDAQSGQVVMDFYYHYRSVSTAKGTLEIKGDKNISIDVRDVVGSRSGQEIKQGELTGTPVFMDEKMRIDRLVQARLERIINVEHKDVLPVLQVQTPLLVDRLLASEDERGLDYDTLATKFGRQEFDILLASYLKPQVVRLNNTKTESDVTINIHEDEESRQKAGGGGFTIYSIGFGQASKEDRERALNRFERATGVTLASTKDETLFRPHNIKIWRVREGWDKVEFNEKTLVYLSIGKETQYLVASGVPSSFTEKVAEQNAQAAQETDIYNGVRRGMVLPFFGSELPEGFVWADGKTNWPNEDWVPDHLRNNKPVPNLNDFSIIGTNNPNEVGEEVATRMLTGTGTVGADGLTVALAGREGVAIDKGNRNGGHLWVPGGSSKGGLVMADPGGKIGDCNLHTFLEPTAKQTVEGKASATFEASLSRGSIPGVKGRWIIRVK